MELIKNMPVYYKDKDEFEIVTKEKIQKYLDIAEEEDFKVLLALAWLTGARISELLALKRRDVIIDEETKTISFKLITLKQKKISLRELPFSFDDPFIGMIIEYVKKIDDEYAKLFDYSKRYYQKELEKINKELYGDDEENKSEWITFHYLRHSLITYLARELNATPYEIKSWTGHKSSAFEEYIIQKAVERFKGKMGLRR